MCNVFESFSPLFGALFSFVPGGVRTTALGLHKAAQGQKSKKTWMGLIFYECIKYEISGIARCSNYIHFVCYFDVYLHIKCM